jgi:hypothetical protein
MRHESAAIAPPRVKQCGNAGQEERDVEREVERRLRARRNEPYRKSPRTWPPCASVYAPHSMNSVPYIMLLAS